MLAAEAARSPNATALAPTGTGRGLVELWFRIARWEWTSVAMVPADRGGSVRALAVSMAEAGKSVDATPVTAIAMATLDAFSARTLGELQRVAAREGMRTPARTATLETAARVVGVGEDDEPSAGSEVAPRANLALPSGGRVIVAIPSVLDEPLGLAVTQQASVVLVAIRLGKTPLADARGTIELIGRDRVSGCVLV
jgi:hypothetical protein